MQQCTRTPVCKWRRHLVIAVVVVLAGNDVTRSEEKRPSPGPLKLGNKPRLVNDPTRLQRALSPVARSGAWKLRVNEERSRGPGLRVYPLVAPATVLIRSGNGHGTGFVIDSKGWIVTNHHVVDGAKVDPRTNARMVTVYVGKLQDGWMQVIEDPVPAIVYKTNKRQDLALLKLTRMPKGMKRLTALRIAKRVPAPGSDCVAIGHPVAGMLWTVRSGEISGAGKWPAEMIDVMIQRLSLTGSNRDRFRRMLAKAPSRRVVISSCGLNPGDSGGPLVNNKGELVAISFAIPKSRGNRGISLDKFSYHVHLKEFQAFVKDRPKTPETVAPDPWPVAVYRALLDVDKDGTPDTLIFALNKKDPAVGYLADLDQDSAKNKGGSGKSLRDTWDFEFGWQRTPLHRTFYDTDNDGKIDLVLTDANGDGIAETELIRKGSDWVSRPTKSKLVDPSRFQDKKLGHRLSLLPALK